MLLVIAIVAGALVGALAAGETGALAGALFGWLIVRSLRQEREIATLRARLPPAAAAAKAQARDGVGDIGAKADGATSTTPSPSMPAAAPVAAAASSIASTTAAQPELDATPAVAPPVAATIDRRAAAAPRRDVLAPIRRWLFGGNTIVKVGVGILFIGLAFLARYASEHAHVPIEVRLAGIGVAAIALLAFGWKLRTRRPEYAQVLQGGAVAVLYLTLFAAFRYAHVLDAVPAFALMVAVAVLAALLAVLQDARALAVVGALGGFATPLIVSTGSNNHVALFAYYIVLDAGIALVAWSKTWRLLNLVGFVATFVVATAWGVLQYRADDYATSQAFLIAFFLLFALILVLPARRLGDAASQARAPARDAWVNSSLLFGLPTVTFALEYGLVRGTPYGAAFAALVLAGFYVALAAWMRRRPGLAVTFEASLAIATVFLTLVIPFALDERSTAGAWTLEAAGLVWIGFRQRRGLPRVFGYVLFALAGLAMLVGHERYGAPAMVFNVYLFNGAMAAAAALAAAFFVDRARAGGLLASGEDACEALLIGCATLWLVSTATIEIDAFVAERFVFAASLAAASAIAALDAALAQRLQWRGIAWPALAHAPLAFLFALWTAAMLADPFARGGWWAWPLALVVHLLVLRFAAPCWPRAMAHGVHTLGVVTLALVGALGGRALTATWGEPSSAWPWLGWLIAPAALLMLVTRRAVLERWPLRAEPDAYRVSAAAVLAAGLWLWTLVANVASDGSAAPLPHVPLLNPLDIGIGVALAATLVWLQSAGRIARWSLAMAAAAAFVWLNAILVRAFHHYGGVPYHVDAWVGSLAVQTGITLLWTAIALVAMWFGAARAARLPWVCGAALLAVVVVKLLVVDLSGSGSVTRIVSFIGVGVLMLVIGYVAPLPAKESRHAAA